MKSQACVVQKGRSSVKIYDYEFLIAQFREVPLFYEARKAGSEPGRNLSPWQEKHILFLLPANPKASHSERLSIINNPGK